MAVVEARVEMSGRLGCTAGSLESAIDFESRSLENLNSHSHLENGSLMGFHSAERAAQGGSQGICSRLYTAVVYLCPLVCLYVTVMPFTLPINTGQGATEFKMHAWVK